MSPKEIAGCFHSDRIMNGRKEALDRWRVTTASVGVAESVARFLGGGVEGMNKSSAPQWEVITESSAVEVIVREVSAGGAVFYLAGEPDLGEFFLRCWNSGQMSRVSDIKAPIDVRCELRLEPVQFKTRTGLMILYFLPSIKILTSGN